jgi:hypothetical protein
MMDVEYGNDDDSERNDLSSLSSSSESTDGGDTLDEYAFANGDMQLATSDCNVSLDSKVIPIVTTVLILQSQSLLIQSILHELEVNAVVPRNVV